MIPTTTATTYTINATNPHELPLPRTELKWWISGAHPMGDLVTIEGTEEAIAKFVADNWGPDVFVEDYVVGLVVADIEDAVATWERGEQASPDQRDYVIGARRILERVGPKRIAETLAARSDEAGEDVEELIADAVAAKQERGELQEVHELARYIVAELTAEPTDTGPMLETREMTPEPIRVPTTLGPFVARVGDRVELVSTTDPYTALDPGTRGTVTLIDALGTIHVRWDDGHLLGLVPGQDVFRVVLPVVEPGPDVEIALIANDPPELLRRPTPDGVWVRHEGSREARIRGGANRVREFVRDNWGDETVDELDESGAFDPTRSPR
jgi:Domain of unknown function (DUF4314)